MPAAFVGTAMLCLKAPLFLGDRVGISGCVVQQLPSLGICPLLTLRVNRFMKYSTVICEGFYLLVKAILYQGVKSRFDVLVNVCVKFFACA